jgi:hypothetical protein
MPRTLTIPISDLTRILDWFLTFDWSPGADRTSTVVPVPISGSALILDRLLSLAPISRLAPAPMFDWGLASSSA